MLPSLKMDVAEDLDVLWCDDCHTSHGLDCPKLGSTIKIQDKRVETRALATLPDSLRVKVIDGSRYVVAAVPISRRTQFGPLEARQLDGNQRGGQILYKIFDDRSVVASFDLSDDNCCNWMSLVPLNTDPLLQNLVSIQHKGQIYYLASRNIKKGEKLYVWYSPNYGAKMTSAASSDTILLPSKKVTSGRPCGNIGMVTQEKVWSSARVHGKPQTSLVSLGQDSISGSMIEETDVSGNRRRSEEGDGDYSEDEGDDYECDTNTDWSSDEHVKSSSSATILQETSSVAREAREEVMNLEDVMEAKESSIDEDDITHCKKASPGKASTLSLHNREHFKASLSLQSLQEEKGIYDCFLCHIHLPGAEMFINHMVEVHGATNIDQTGSCFRYPCHLCTTVAPSSKLLQDHMTSKHKDHMIDTLKCCKCPKVLQNFAELQQHELRHRSLLSVVCHVCGERYLKVRMDDHLKEKHTAIEEGYVCLQCGHMSTTLVDMMGHVRWHDDWNHGGKEKQKTGRGGGEESRLEEEKELRDSPQLRTGTHGGVGGHHLEKVTRRGGQNEEKTGGDVNGGRQSDRLPLRDTKSAARDVDQSMPREKKWGRINVKGQRKVGRRKKKLEEEVRKIKRRKLYEEDGASKSAGEDENDREDSEMPLRQYNLRVRQRVLIGGYQNDKADEECTMEEGVDENDDKEVQFKCHLCESEFQSKQILDSHLGVHAYRRKGKALVGDPCQYPCKECGKVLYSARSLVLHGAKSHKDAKQECQYCDYKCVAMVTLKEHILSNHKEVDLGIPENFQYPCQDCDLVFLKFFRLTKHMQTHLTKQFKCEKCCRFFSRKDGLQYHICNPRILDSGAGINSQKPASHKCKYCQKEFDQVKVLNIHVFTHFINVPSRSGTFVLLRVPTKSSTALTCSYCHGKFNSPTLLVQHVARAHQMKIFPCSRCFEILGSCESLLTHLQNHTENDTDKCEPQSILGSVSTCKDCFAVFPNESTLQRHMTVHLKTKDFICDICGKTFSRKSNLRNHLKSHSLSKPYQCEICGKYLKTLQSLQIHINAHTEDRKHRCYVCLRGFTQKGNLNKHMSKCVPRRDIKCKYCSLKFRDFNAVASHEQHIHSSQQNVDVM